MGSTKPNTNNVQDTSDQTTNNQSVKRPNSHTKPKPATAPLVWRKRYSLIYQPPLYNPVYFSLVNKQPITLANVRPASHAFIKAPMSYEHPTIQHHSVNASVNSTTSLSAPTSTSAVKPTPLDEDELGWDEWNEETWDLFPDEGPMLSHNQASRSNNQSINQSNKSQQNRRKPVSGMRPKPRLQAHSYPSTEVIKQMTNQPINTLFNHSKLDSFAAYLTDLVTWSSLFWSTLGSPSSITPNQLAELRLLALQSSLCASSHGRLSLKSLALVAHLDSIEDSSDHSHNQSINQSISQQQVDITLPVFHRCLLQWAALAQNVTITHLNVSAAAEWLSSLHNELLNTDQLVSSPTSKSQRARFKSLSSEASAALGVMRSEAIRQWQRATHSLTSHHPTSHPPTAPQVDSNNAVQSVSAQSNSSTSMTSLSKTTHSNQSMSLSSMPRTPHSVAAALNSFDERKETITHPISHIGPSSFHVAPTLRPQESPLMSRTNRHYDESINQTISQSINQSNNQSLSQSTMRPNRRYPSSSDVLELAREQVNQADHKSLIKSTNNFLNSSHNQLSRSPSSTSSNYSRPVPPSSFASNSLTIGRAPSSMSPTSIIDMLQSLDAQHTAAHSKSRRR